jgi:hypothetical protein
VSRAERCAEHPKAGYSSKACAACADAAWRVETATYAKPRESLERFRVRWRAHMLALVGYHARPAMPPVQTDAQYAAEIRRHGMRRIVTSFQDFHRPNLGATCRCADCELVRWNAVVERWHGSEAAAA